jgi:hypothetical protein
MLMTELLIAARLSGHAEEGTTPLLERVEAAGLETIRCLPIHLHRSQVWRLAVVL